MKTLPAVLTFLFLAPVCLSAASMERGSNSLKKSSPGPDPSSKKLSGISSASISSSVKVAKNMEIMGATQTTLGSFGLIGALIGEATKDEPRKKYKAIMDKAGIDIGAIFYQEFSKAYRSKNPLASGKGQAGTIKLEVQKYGFIQAPSGFERIKPVAVGLAEIYDSKNKRVWSDQAQVSTWAEQTSGSTHDEYMSHPDLLRQHFTETFRTLSQRIVDQMALEKK